VSNIVVVCHIPILPSRYSHSIPVAPFSLTLIHLIAERRSSRKLNTIRVQRKPGLLDPSLFS